MLTALEEATFRVARGSIARGAPPNDSKLFTAETYAVACKIAQRCVSEPRSSSPFPLMIWKGGATHVDDGVAIHYSLSGFAHLLYQRSLELAPKRQGWVVEPVTNLDGRRTNASTVAMHALFLDADGTGAWNILQQNLGAFGYSFVLYESGGSQADKPKWRVVFPLSEPFDVSSELKRVLWKQFYNNARVVFGALAQLTGPGFDPATDTPCNPWFLTERRDVRDLRRQIFWFEGGTLDLGKFLMLTANLDEDPAEPARPVVDKTHFVSPGLNEEQLDVFIKELASATSNIPAGRHDLYLCLPGVLLDRGMHPDTVLALIEAVSREYPRHHPDLHRDNIHNAKTTIAKWESSGRITRIGTLQARWPSVAAVVDTFLPNRLNAMLAEMSKREAAVEPSAAPQVRDKHFKRHPLSQQQINPAITEIRRSRRLDKTKKQSIVMIIRRMQDGLPFETPNNTTVEIDDCLKLVMNELGYHLDVAVPWSDILDWGSAALHVLGVVQSVERTRALEIAFGMGRGQKVRAEMKQAEKRETRRQRMSNEMKKYVC